MSFECFEPILTALALPAAARLDKRVPRTLLSEHGAASASDRKAIQEGIDALWWLAVIKPATVALPVAVDGAAPEIAVLGLELRASALASRLIERTHRAVPYPVVLLTAQGSSVTVSLAQKRPSQQEPERLIVEGGVLVSPELAHGQVPQLQPVLGFLNTMSFPASSVADLGGVYASWTAAVEAFCVARVTGQFVLAADAEAAASRRAALLEYDRIVAERARLVRESGRATQMNRRVELNLMLKRLDVDLARAAAELDP